MRSKMMVTTPGGTLNDDQSLIRVSKSMTDLIKKTHLHVVFWLIAPPIRGPVRLPRACVAASWAACTGYFSLGTISYAITKASEKHPAAPTP